MKKNEFETIIKNMNGYIHSLANRFSNISSPYTKNDLMQNAKLWIWTECTRTDCPIRKPNTFWKKVIRNSMINFHRDFVKKINRAEKAYKDACFEDCVPDFSDDVIMKVTLEEYYENTKET